MEFWRKINYFLTDDSCSQKTYLGKCKVLTAVLLNFQVFWDVMPCRLVKHYGVL